MKTGKTIVELANEISRQQNAKRDFLINANKVSAFVHESKLNLGFPIDQDLFMGELTSNGHIQLGSYCDIPKKYYDKMMSHPDLLSKNISHWLLNSEDKRMIRTS